MIKVFDYIEELDAFVVRAEFVEAVEQFGLAEWTPVVWMGRLFALDQDFGEHWFDNWDERLNLEEKATAIGIDSEQLMIVVPSCFTQKHPKCYNCNKIVRQTSCPMCGKQIFVQADGPCHSDRQKRAFWTDVLKSIHVSYDTLKTLGEIL